MRPPQFSRQGVCDRWTVITLPRLLPSHLPIFRAAFANLYPNPTMTAVRCNVDPSSSIITLLFYLSQRYHVQDETLSTDQLYEMQTRTRTRLCAALSFLFFHIFLGILPHLVAYTVPDCWAQANCHQSPFCSLIKSPPVPRIL
jgi:hypothetical protein